MTRGPEPMAGCRQREEGVALLMMVVLGVGLMLLAVVSLQMTLFRSATDESRREAVLATQIAESAAAQAIVKIKSGGVTAPKSGGGGTAAWQTFSGGSFYYDTDYDATTEVSTVRAWGRFPVDPYPSSSTEAPDDPLFDDDGWMVKGIEVTVKASTLIPETPLYFGNGGVENPEGGFAWAAGTDPADPSTYGTVTSPSSWQDSSVPFEISALDYPTDYNYNGGTPTPASSNPHPYAIWGAQTLVGQRNIEAWFANSAGSGNDPTVNVTPPPTSSYYDTSDPLSPNYPYPVDGDMPDVQDFSHALWNTYSGDPSATLLTGGTHSGTYGDLTTPSVTFVTGRLDVAAGTTFEGAGILVIRDDYDPNVDTDNTPATKADLAISGTFKWTGLVIITGWAPSVTVNAGADSTIVGAFLGEDSVQSGGEGSLDTAMIIMRVSAPFRILYSYGIFAPGGLVNPMLPRVNKSIIAVREL